MTRFLTGTGLALAVAASLATSQPQDAPPVQPAPVVTPTTPKAQPKVERKFVSASSLNLREAPASDSSIVAKLPIGLELAVERTEGDWSRVSNARGQRGWVGTAFLADERLDWADAFRFCEQAKDPKEALAWAQRAAALRPLDISVLQLLEKSYRTLGRTVEADQVTIRMKDLGGPKYEAWFPAPLRAEIDAVRDEMAAVSTVEEFAVARKHAIEVAAKLSDVVGNIWDPEEGKFGDDDNADWLIPMLPGMEFEWAPEGMGVGLSLSVKPWKEVAARTASPDDDHFVSFISTMFDNFEGSGWIRWHERDWDFGGCNRLGGGKHLSALKDSDKLKNSIFAAEVLKKRVLIIDDILEDDTEFFPFCTHGGPTPKVELAGELASILKGVTLTDAEREKLLSRDKRGWPNNP